MGRIPEEIIQQVLASTDIVELIGSYFPLKRAGANFKALCPFHQEKSPSFNVNPSRQSFHCFGCGTGGTAIRFIMDYDHVPFPDAVRKLADRAGIAIEEAQYDPELERVSRLKGRLLELHKDAAEWFHHLLFKDPVADTARAYLKKRGISMETAREWQLGYAPEASDPIKDWARAKGLKAELLIQGGLLSLRDEDNPSRGTYCRFRHRLIFPIADEMGQVIAFSGRVLEPDAKAAKYTNSPETLLFNKSRTFYGFDKTRRDILREGAAIVCEGQLDLIACYSSGIRNAVAPLGTAFTEQHARILSRNAREIILCFDSDDAGYKAAERAFAALAEVNLIPRVAAMPPGEDPDSIIKAGGADDLKRVLENAKDFLDFQIDYKSAALDFNSLGEKMQFAREMADGVSLVADKVLRESAIHKVASRLGIPAQEFRENVTQAIRKKTTAQRRPAPSGIADRAAAARAEAPPLDIRNKSVAYLCQVLLTDARARAWLLESESPGFLSEIPETGILVRIWNAPIDLREPATVSAFLSTLSPPEEAFLTRLIHQPVPAPENASLRECVQKLKIQSLENQIEEKKSLMNRPNLSPSEKINLLKEFLDLETRLNDISPFAPRTS